MGFGQHYFIDSCQLQNPYSNNEGHIPNGFPNGLGIATSLHLQPMRLFLGNANLKKKRGQGGAHLDRLVGA